MISTCPRCQKLVSIPGGVDAATLVKCPLCDEQYALGDAIALTPPELIPVEAVAVSSPTDHGAEDADQHDSEADNEAVAAVRSYSAPTGVRRRRRKPKSAVRTLVEVVLGGLGGCLLGYYALAFYFGPEFRHTDFPQLNLPGISWITSLRSHENGPVRPLEKKPANLKGGAVNHGRESRDALAAKGETA
jgi:hypothetical protein